MSTPGVSDVDRISWIADPVVRNLQITQCYHELSRAMERLFRGAANWCTFATWASRQAGQTIRGEDLAQAFQDLVNRSPEVSARIDVVAGQVAALARRHDPTAPREAIRRPLDPEAAFERAGRAVGLGNKKVFEEIGREFARLFATFSEDTAFDPERTARFCDELRPRRSP